MTPKYSSIVFLCSFCLRTVKNAYNGRENPDFYKLHPHFGKFHNIHIIQLIPFLLSNSTILSEQMFLFWIKSTSTNCQYTFLFIFMTSSDKTALFRFPHKETNTRVGLDYLVCWSAAAAAVALCPSRQSVGFCSSWHTAARAAGPLSCPLSTGWVNAEHCFSALMLWNTVRRLCTAVSTTALAVNISFTH